MNWVLEVPAAHKCLQLALVNKGPGKPSGVYLLMMQNLKALYVLHSIFVFRVARYGNKY